VKNLILYPLVILIRFFQGVSDYCQLMYNMFRSYKSWDFYLKLSNIYMFQIGIKSIPIVIVTGLFAGMVLAVQASYQVQESLIPGMEWTIGSVVGEAILLELAPMITALVMTGKIGATIAAEIGTMRVTEQIDALETLSLDPIAYLIVPRVLAGLVMFPVLVIIADFFGIFGGLIACLSTLDINSYQFVKGLKSWFNPWDAIFGLIKAVHFGFAITSIACYFGFYTTGGAQGVGKSTMNTVVASCVTIVILDYFLAEILL